MWKETNAIEIREPITIDWRNFMRFSQRMKITPAKTNLQIESIDDDLNNGLWDIYGKLIFRNGFKHYGSPTGYNAGIKIEDWCLKYFENVWHSLFKRQFDTMPTDLSGLSSFIKNYFFTCEWFELYDFLEFTTLYFNNQSLNAEFNTILERELSGYRVIDGYFSPITDKLEINQLESILSETQKFQGVYIHLTHSLTLLSDRKNPDYRNSIKESISAVESICKIIVQDEKAELGPALKKIEEKNVHSPCAKKKDS